MPPGLLAAIFLTVPHVSIPGSVSRHLDDGMFYTRALAWCTSRVCSLSLIAVVCLLYFALWHSQPLSNGANKQPPKRGPIGLTNSQFAFIGFTVFVHAVALIFPFRLCWGTVSITKGIKKSLKQQSPSRRSSPYLSSKEERKHDLDPTSIELESKANRENVLHAIILPNYKEEIDTLRETLDVLASHAQAPSSYDIYLAMEQGEDGSEAKAKTLIAEFATRFHAIEYTLHPRGIPGEAQGKSSNLCWASRYLSGKYDIGKVKKNVIVTVLDADSHLSFRHFAHISKMHFEYPDTANMTIYVPPIIFDRNAHLVPTVVRVADLFWGGVGLSGHVPFDPIAPPTSVYSLPLELVDSVGGWDAGSEAIGEDLHMYVKCFFATKGHLTCRSVFSAASHSNVHSNERGIGGWIRSCNARYKQALRHMWGALDSGFVIKCASAMLLKIDSTSSTRPHWINTFLLFYRMYEAHFLPAHLALLVVGCGIYTSLTPSAHIPLLLEQVLDLTAYIRMIFLFNFVIFLFLYEPYHRLCLKTREAEMIRAGLAEGMYDSFSSRKSWKNWLDYIVFPVTGILFGSIPALVALVCHFWTLNLVYKVSKKPSRMALV